MSGYKAFDPNVEVHGQPMQTFVQCLNKDRISPVLEELGITEIDADKWYPQQLWLDIFNQIQDRHLDFGTFMDIGMRVIELTRYPEEVKNIPFVDFMVHGADQTHQHNHRGGDAGGYEVSLSEPSTIVVKARVPYPDDFVYGCYFQLAKQFGPKGKHFTVNYASEQPRREEGGEFTTLHITWDKVNLASLNQMEALLKKR